MVEIFVILNLILLEVLLSIDNAAVLAVMVKPLPEKQQAKALRYGILGAYLFRGIALLLASFLMKLVFLKILGGAYLIYLAFKHFTQEEGESSMDAKSIPGLSLFWSTVIYVEIADIVFSLDNIFAAVAMSDKLWVVIAGVFIGILGMRFVAKWFIVVMEKYPSLNDSAFLVICILGIKLVLTGVLDYMPFFHELKEALESHTTDLIVSVLSLVIFFFPLIKSKIRFS